MVRKIEAKLFSIKKPKVNTIKLWSINLSYQKCSETQKNTNGFFRIYFIKLRVIIHIFSF